MAFCEWLSAREGQTYRLPTEAEWEYACRAGKSTAWITGDNEVAGVLPYVANLADLALRRRYGRYDVAAGWNDGYAFTAPVGNYLPNAYVLYDMHGNVWEWCSDYYSPVYYQFAPMDDPTGPDAGEDYVQRGASFFHHSGDARSADRDHGPEDQAQNHLGFRVVREFR